ncbi:MAG: protein kinase [Planctomycetes bacterium]|nr:protein kinase [Planctomycetota bacterium]
MKQPPHDARVDALLDQMLHSECTPAEVCRDTPELLAEVSRRWNAMRGVRARLNELFPSVSADDPDAASADPPLPRIPGHAIEAVLGRGGMGIVYRARQLSLHRDVAVKVLLLGVHASAAELVRFRREAQVVAALQHPNIVQVFDTGDADGWPFFTMELMEGGSLADRLRGEPWPARDAATLVATLADAVEKAHRCGVIHRDLKPANVLLTAAGTPKISDFGLARRADEAALTRSGAQMGTPTYMAPEQALGRLEAIGPATDVYALGVVLYQLIVGRPPFDARTPGELHHCVVHDPPSPPSRTNPSVPRDLENVCLRCLHKDAVRRYASAAELAADLQRFLRHEPVLARSVGPFERCWNWCRRKPALAGLLLTGVALLSLALASLLREAGLAAGRRTEIARLESRLGDVIRLAAAGNLAAASQVLDGLSDAGADAWRTRIAAVRADLDLGRQLEGIRLQRAALADERFTKDLGRGVAEERYRAAFAAGKLGSVDEAAAVVAARVAASAVRSSLVTALDDWAMCVADEGRRSWLLEVAQRADPDAPEWLRRLRDPAAWSDPEALAEMAMSVPDPRPVPLLVGLAGRLRERGKDGVAFLGKLLLRHADDFWINYALADAVFWGDHVAAIRYLQAAVALRPDSAVPRVDLARALSFAGRHEEALAQAGIAIDLAPGIETPLVVRANVLARLGRREEAIAAYREVIRIAPASAQARSNLGVALAESDRLEEAVDEYQESLRLRPNAGETRANFGNALGGLGRRDEAIAQYRLGVQAAPEIVCTNYNLGLGLWTLGRFDEAARYLQKTIELDPRHAFAHLFLAESLKGRGRIRDAIAVYQQCLSLKVPDPRPANVLRRMQSLQQGRGEEARSAWQAWLNDVPREHCLWEGYAELCAFVGDLEAFHRACDVLTASLESDEDVRAAGRVGFTCALSPRTDEEVLRATHLVERAIADPSRYEEWERPWFLFARALLAYRGGRFADALAQASDPTVRAIGVAPRLLAAMASRRLGRDDEARARLGAAIADTDWSAAQAIHRDVWVEHVLRREAEALVLPDLADLLAGRRAPSGPERLALLGVCEFEGRHLTTARLYAAAFAADPALATSGDGGHVHRAARAAAFAGSGRGTDGATLGAAEMAELRNQARAWLRLGLAAWRSSLERDAAAVRDAAARTVAAWQKDAGFAALREPWIGEYAPPERDDCRALWKEADDVLARAAAK